MHNKFPRKKIGSLSRAQTEERKQQLADFFDELMTLDLSMEVRTALNDFLEVNSHKTAGSGSGSGSQQERKEQSGQAKRVEEEDDGNEDRFFCDIL